MNYENRHQKQFFTVKEAAQISGLSTNMVDYLCQQKLIMPSAQGSTGRGRGKARKYTFGDIMHLTVFEQLLRHGISVKRIKTAYKNWKLHFSVSNDRQKPDKFLVSDGSRVMLLTKENLLAEIEEGPQYAFSFIVNLNTVFDKVSAHNLSQ